ncbi:hypothetical protein [Variovorax sp. JS1663]|uniref:hypothetical protein n=1 Tax=Variovorax sp. JS1663 TaxID=1851577 RepID=UPI000B344499|nr:hypothetical protein [Variovorax sp. JS1663]OUM04484.1 hypothetical protein A8M77_02035 [Variovorax sp. JS1663]
MGFNAYARVEASLRPEVTRAQVEAACRDFLDWRGYDLLHDDFHLHETGVAYDVATQCFTLQITSECPHGFAVETFQPLVLAVGELAAEPFAATLVDEDTSNEDSREFVVLAGPADQIGEFRFQRARCAIEEQLKDVDLPPDTPGASVAELAVQDTMTFSTMAPGEVEPAEVARVALDLTGLDFVAARRDRIARLAVALAREIAGEELRLSARPGAPAPNWADEESEQRSAPRG